MSENALVTSVGAAAINCAASRAEEFLCAAIGHPGESIAKILGDKYHTRRVRAEGVLGNAGLILLNLGLRPGRVASNVLDPAVEAASLQEEEVLQDTWANLLANAADPRKCNPVLAVFPEMLKVLSPREVKLMDCLSKHRTVLRGLSDREVEEVYRDAPLTLSPPPVPRLHYQNTPILDEQDTNNLQISIDILMGARILWLNKAAATMFSPLGWAFLKACQPPKK